MRNDIKHIKSRLGEHKQSGNELTFQTCPFCGDSKDHFYLNQNSLLYHCFKCNAGGGYYSLAKHIGLELVEKPEVAKAQELKHKAAVWFADLLKDDPKAADARNWLQERGIDAKWLDMFTTGTESIPKRLPIGFYPGTSKLLSYFEKLGYTSKEIAAAGLLSKKTDDRGQVVLVYHTRSGWIGRFKLRMVKGSSSHTIWLGKQSEPCGVFGLGLYDLSSNQQKDAICVEGEFDCLSVQLHTLREDKTTCNVFALSGAMAGSGVDVLAKNGIKKLRLIPDNDPGGLSFVETCLKRSAKHNLSCIVHRIPKEHGDPDEWARSGAVDLKAVFADQVLPGVYLADGMIEYDTQYRQFDQDVPDGLQGARQYVKEKANKLKDHALTDFASALPENVRPFIDKPIVSTRGTRHNRPIDAETFLSMDMPPIPMVVGDGLLPAYGYTMLGGYAKTGKTTLALQLCLAIAAGTPFLGTFPVAEPRAQILYCCLENSDNVIHDILKKQRENWGAPIESIANIHLLDIKGLCLQVSEDVTYLKDILQEKSIRLCVIDPVSRAMKYDQNDYTVVRGFVNKLEAIGKDTGTAFLLIHHFGKPGIVKREAIHALIGSSAWGNFAESIIGIEQWEEEKPLAYKRLTFVFRTVEAPADLCLCRNGKLFDLVTDSDRIPTKQIEKVVEIMKGHGQPIGYTLLTELVKTGIGITDRQAQRLIAVGRESGLIEKGTGKRGKYYLSGDMCNNVML